MNKPIRPSPVDIDALLDDENTRILVCCGSGGVGKTTTAAALAVRAAERGRKTVVLTIDPARRLAQALGLKELDNQPRQVVLEGFEPAGSCGVVAVGGALEPGVGQTVQRSDERDRLGQHVRAGG